MKTAVLFDLGKVLLDFDRNAIIDGFRRNSTLSEAELQKGFAVYASLGFEEGKISADEFYEKMKSLFHLGMTFEDFREVWCDIFSEITEMVKFQRGIRGRYKTYIASNTDALHMPYVLGKYAWLREFDGYALSYELGVRKPEQEFFRRALEKFGLNARECVYIDDIAENTAGARSLGIESVVFTTAKETISELGRMGITV